MKDIEINTEGDILLKNGDLSYTLSDSQHQKDILISDKGHYKQYPTLGVGMINFLQDTDPENMLRTIRKEFSKDGMTIHKVHILNGILNTDAQYEDHTS